MSLTIVVEKIPKIASASINVIVKYGERYENEDNIGVAHFMEHLCFKGTKKRPNAIDISRPLEMIGADYNATTTPDFTNYYATVRSDKIKDIIKIFGDIILNSKIKKSDFITEKNTVIQELDTVINNPEQHIENLINTLIFKGTNLGYSYKKIKEKTKKITNDKIKKNYKKYYIPGNIIVIIAGNVSNVKNLINQSFKFNKKEEKLSSINLINITQKTPRYKNINNNNSQIEIAIGFPILLNNKSKRINEIAILSNILGGGMYSRLFIELREKKGYVYKIYSTFEFYKDIGEFLIYFSVNISDLKNTLKILKTELEKLNNNSITTKEVHETKQNMINSLAKEIDNTKTVVNILGYQTLYNLDTHGIQEEIEVIKKINVKNINKLCQEIFTNSKLNVASIGDKKCENQLINFTKKLFIR